MGYKTLDNVVRGAIANKGMSTLHKYVPYLHWAFRGLEKFQQEGFYTDIKSTRDYLDKNNCLPFPKDMQMWSKIGIINNGVVSVFVNDDSLSLNSKDHNNNPSGVPRGLFAYDSDSLDLLYTTNIYVSTDKGVIVVSSGAMNWFKVNWREKKFQIKNRVESKVYLEYIADVHDPSTATLVNDVATEYLESFIYYREARFTLGAAHRETRASEAEWLEAQDDLAANMSDLTGEGLRRAVNMSTRKSIDQ